MTKRSFLKLFGLGSAATVAAPTVATVIMPKLTESNETPQFVISVTKDFLIPLSDGSFNVNVYGEYCILITQVIIPAKQLVDSKMYRFESEMIAEADLTEAHWIKFKQQVITYVTNNPDKGTSITGFCPKIIFS